mgnify:CR=1 FL=1
MQGVNDGRSARAARVSGGHARAHRRSRPLQSSSSVRRCRCVAGGVSTCVLNVISGPDYRNDQHRRWQPPLPTFRSRRRSSPSAASSIPARTARPARATVTDRASVRRVTVNGTGQFGDVSLDCPPNPGSNARTLTINLNIATGTQTKTVEAANPTCRQTGYTGLKCLCDTCNNSNRDRVLGGNGDCPANGGGPGICGGRRCLGGPENPDSRAARASPAPTTALGATTRRCAPAARAMNPRVCNGGANDGASCNNTTACPGGVCGECSGGGSCNRPGEADPAELLPGQHHYAGASKGCISIRQQRG